MTYHIAEQLRRGDELQLPAELQLANGEKVIATEFLQRHKNERAAFKGLWKSEPVLIKFLLDGKHSANHIRRETKGNRILTALKIKTPALHFSARCAGGRVLVFEFLHGKALSELWKTQPQQRTEIADYTTALLAKLHRHGYRHADFHLNNFFAVGDVFYVIDVGAIRRASYSLRMGTLFCVPKKYGYWQRYNIGKCFARIDPKIRDVLMDALARNYPQAATDPKLVPEINAQRELRIARREKPGHFRRLLRKIRYTIRHEVKNR